MDKMMQKVTVDKILRLVFEQSGNDKLKYLYQIMYINPNSSIISVNYM